MEYRYIIYSTYAYILKKIKNQNINFAIETDRVGFRSAKYLRVDSITSNLLKELCGN